MSGRLFRTCMLGVVVTSLFAVPVLAEGNATDSVDRLQAMLEAQQRKIEALEQQVAATTQADMDQARAEQMKQQIREVLSEAEFRETLVPATLQAGYDNGFFIRSTDEKFMIKFNGLMQFRYTYYSTRSENRYLAPGYAGSRSRSGFSFARLRFIVGGHAYTKDLTYHITFDASEDGQYDATALYAWVNYRIADEFQIKAGIFRLASTRADFGSTATMQFVDYPYENALFGLGRGIGVRLWGKLAEGKGEYYLDFVDSLNSVRQTITADEDRYTRGHDNNPAIVFRTVWALMGGHCLYPEDAGHFTAPCDFGIHDEPALNVGAHFAYTSDWFDGTLRMPFKRQTFFREGGFGLTSSEGLDIYQMGIDAGFKYQGFSATAEFDWRILNVTDSDRPPFTPLYQLTGDDSTNDQWGGYLQLGYFLPIPGMERKFEIVGRAGGLRVHHGGAEGVWTYTGGLNYYIDGHKVKLQSELMYIPEAPVTRGPNYSVANVNDDALIFRVQLQVAF